MNDGATGENAFTLFGVWDNRLGSSDLSLFFYPSTIYVNAPFIRLFCPFFSHRNGKMNQPTNWEHTYTGAWSISGAILGKSTRKRYARVAREPWFKTGFEPGKLPELGPFLTHDLLHLLFIARPQTYFCTLVLMLKANRPENIFSIYSKSKFLKTLRK